MIIMSVDYGDKRTGIAVCDKSELLASPVCVIFEAYEPKLIDKICQIATEKNVQMLVIGLPKNMDGSEGDRAQKCKEFAQKLGEQSGIQTVMWDERLTTVSAHKALNVVNVRAKKRKNIVDAVSAVMILEDFISARKNSK
ncbi:MAG: Holliday junction resolvase RuvX [Acutalibacteraceae bacterium]